MTEKLAVEQRWQEAWLPFETFVPSWRGRRLDLPSIEPAPINLFGLSIADGIDGDCRLEVESISAFAPNGEDVRLASQLSAVSEAQNGIDERDMVLIVALADGSSNAGGRPLSAAESKALRTQYSVDAQGFTVVLVGLDGGTKRTESAPMLLTEVFAQIDAMPMRRAEHQQRRRAREPAVAS